MILPLIDAKYLLFLRPHAHEFSNFRLRVACNYVIGKDEHNYMQQLTHHYHDTCDKALKIQTSITTIV